MNCMNDKTFVDTNVLIYAHDVDAKSKHHAAKGQFLAELWSERSGIVSMQHMIAIWPDWDVDCRPPDESSFLPPRVHFYPVEEILRFGVATGNTCGRLEVSAKPGELVLFVRPPHWWEAIRR